MLLIRIFVYMLNERRIDIEYCNFLLVLEGIININMFKNLIRIVGIMRFIMRNVGFLLVWMVYINEVFDNV